MSIHLHMSAKAGLRTNCQSRKYVCSQVRSCPAMRLAICGLIYFFIHHCIYSNYIYQNPMPKTWLSLKFFGGQGGMGKECHDCLLSSHASNMLILYSHKLIVYSYQEGSFACCSPPSLSRGAISIIFRLLCSLVKKCQQLKNVKSDFSKL
jgi:hypothetical protein